MRTCASGIADGLNQKNRAASGGGGGGGESPAGGDPPNNTIHHYLSFHVNEPPQNATTKNIWL